MHFVCPVCQELIGPSASISCTPCGHMFHSDCLTEWIDKYKSKTCPQCRSIVQKKSIYKLFPNIAEDEVCRDDPVTLQYKLDTISTQLRGSQMESKNLKEELTKSKEILTDLRGEIKKLEHDHVNDVGMLAHYKSQLKDYKRNLEIIMKLKAENNTLIQELERYGSVRELMESREVNETMKSYQDTKGLAFMVVSLKKELVHQRDKAERRRKDLYIANGKVREKQDEINKLKEASVIQDKRLHEYEKQFHDIKRKRKEPSSANLTFSLQDTSQELFQEEIDSVHNFESPYLPLKKSSFGALLVKKPDNINSKARSLKKPNLYSLLDSYKPLPEEAFRRQGGLPQDEFAEMRENIERKKQGAVPKRKKVQSQKETILNKAQQMSLDAFLESL